MILGKKWEMLSSAEQNTALYAAERAGRAQGEADYWCGDYCDSDHAYDLHASRWGVVRINDPRRSAWRRGYVAARGV